MAGMRRMGISHVAYEASSHGLDQFRAEGVPVKAAAFTNLSRDHLDYHLDMDAYFAPRCACSTKSSLRRHCSRVG
jgi:UDP-N-acetylmuramoyl-L-alanyl-D-glutamate--2,6-diaminopimelate ligase